MFFCSFKKILEFSRACTIFIISFISSFEIISVVFPDPNIFLCIPASAADAPAVNPKGIKTLLVNGLITFLINGYPVFNTVPSNLLKNPPDWIILLIWALERFESVDILLLKASLIFVFYLVVSNNSCGKSFRLNVFKLIFNCTI